MKFLFSSLIFFFLFSFSLKLQGQGNGRVFNKENKTLFFIREGAILDSNRNDLLLVRGNIFYRGRKEKRDSIAFLFKNKGVFKNKLSYLFAPDLQKSIYTFNKGRIYAGKGINIHNFLLEIRPEDGGKYRFLTGEEEEEVATALGNLSESELAALAVLLLDLPEIQERTGPLITDEQLIPSQGIIGILKPAWRNDDRSEWTWDGRIMKPGWGDRPEDEWVFNGESIVPYWDIREDQEWSWDGQILKPAWGEFPDHTYIYDGYTLKPYWDEESTERVWIIDGDKVRPKWINDPNMEYIIEGKFPVPLIALIVLGYADRPR